MINNFFNQNKFFIFVVAIKLKQKTNIMKVSEIISKVELAVSKMNDTELIAKKEDQQLSYANGLILDLENWMLANTVIELEISKRAL